MELSSPCLRVVESSALVDRFCARAVRSAKNMIV